MLLEYLTTWLGATWFTLAAMSPYLLLGFIVAGVLSVWLSPLWVERHLGGRGLWPTIKAAALGVPLPLCSCGVIPVAASLRQHGAGKGATTSFLLSTPQTGVDSILATYALLGPVFAMIRPVIALVSGIIGGSLVSLFDQNDSSTSSTSKSNTSSAPTAINHPTKSTTDQTASTSCCEGATCATHKPAPDFAQKMAQAARYGLITLPNDIAKPLIFGILLAGLIAAVATPNQLEPWLGGGFMAMLLMLALGTPLYVCSTGSIPLGLSFLHLGASPGAVLVFLIAGPATNAATISVTWKVLGRRTALIYLGTVIITAMSAGLALDAWVTSVGTAHVPHEHLHGSETMGIVGHLWAGGLLLMLIVSMTVSRLRSTSATTDQGANDMNQNNKTSTYTLNVQGMTCSHCVAAVTRALREVAGVKEVQVTLTDGKAMVVSDSSQTITLNPRALVQKVEALGYKAKLQG